MAQQNTVMLNLLIEFLTLSIIIDRGINAFIGTFYLMQLLD